MAHAKASCFCDARKLATLWVNWESTSSAMIMMSGSTEVKSTEVKLRWIVSKMHTCRIHDSCTIKGAV